MKKPKVLLVDIETAPIIASVWALFDQNVSLSQIKQDWHVLSFAAKWLDSDKMIYRDQRNAKKVEDDKDLLKEIWKLLDEADIVVGQNSNNFDLKKLNARFILNGMQPPSSYRKIDTFLIAKKHFAFTSNKLEYMSEKLCTKYKKLKHKKFPGFEMWKECLAGNKEAWKEMEKYNKHDVLALEELYKKLIPWDNSINFQVYSDDPLSPACKCGKNDYVRNGYFYTDVAKYQRYKCRACGSETRSRTNLLSVEKRKSLKVKTNR